jgi:L-asparaginase II
MVEDPQGARLGASVLDDAYVPVAVTTRSGFDESIHRGALVALHRDGSIAWSVGDPDLGIYARSSLKPLQAAAMVAAGLALTDELLAVVCASHDGRPEHLAAVRAILAGAGLSEEDLQNTPTLPLDAGASRDAIRNGVGPAAVLQNCSGKHAGMLATAVSNGWPTAGYLSSEHPVQRLIVESLRGATGAAPSAHVGVDGCGAPAPVVPLVGLARAVRALAVDGHPVHRAMTSHPEMVGGPTRDVTRLMQLVPGLVAKDGAEGVHVAALPDGRAVALKIADGAGRARAPVMVAALRSLGVGLASDAVGEVVLGHGSPVGRVRSLVGRP